MVLCVRPLLLVVLTLFGLIFCFGEVSVAMAETVVVNASQDITLINSTTGNVSNGKGPLFSGRTGGSGPGALRALLAFDVASAIPAGSTVTDVELMLTVLKAGGGGQADAYALHRVEQNWGEGTSVSAGGGGSPSTANDATWIHTFFDSSTWTTPGSDFVDTASVTETLSGTGSATWGSTTALVADVQAWVEDSSTNFGWILIGNENRNGSSRRFASREAANSAPQLTITFTPVPEPCSLALVCLSSLGGILSLHRRRG